VVRRIPVKAVPGHPVPPGVAAPRQVTGSNDVTHIPAPVAPATTTGAGEAPVPTPRTVSSKRKPSGAKPQGVPQLPGAEA
jgi:hypothetical protein